MWFRRLFCSAIGPSQNRNHRVMTHLFSPRIFSCYFAGPGLGYIYRIKV